ncbi:MAG: hypothetical protein QS748_07875 [Candidatus Endonucleobacter bathymodioli]|uniref:Uncharacterized protein n=1 Tax=Candidatus Endonucleibacter bathymodioli TaxID=539814 RepID=A0AA90P161_9GAMM|nr:hypothetical protein [Candidatus Endonucleobacter bathymodioli]
MQSIFDDGKIILQEVTECEALNKETLRASFYKNGVLINNKFSASGLTPEIFAEAGMKFSGSEGYDKVVCALNEKHAIIEW